MNSCAFRQQVGPDLTLSERLAIFRQHPDKARGSVHIGKHAKHIKKRLSQSLWFLSDVLCKHIIEPSPTLQLHFQLLNKLRPQHELPSIELCAIHSDGSLCYIKAFQGSHLQGNDFWTHFCCKTWET